MITNRLNLSPVWPIIAKYFQEDGDDGSDYAPFTASRLARPVRQVILQMRHGKDVDVDVADIIPLMEGTAFHAYLEKAAEKLKFGNAEKRYTREFITSTGFCKIIAAKPDLVVGDTLYEYKGTPVRSIMTDTRGVFAPKPEWLLQAQVAAWCVGKQIKHVQVEARLKDWSKLKAKFDKGYPQTPIVAFKGEAPGENNMGFTMILETLVMEFLRAMPKPDSELPVCPWETLWIKPASFMLGEKAKGKRRTRFVPTMVSVGFPECCAETRAKGNETGKPAWYRPIEYTRCENYCDMRSICNQFRDADDGRKWGINEAKHAGLLIDEVEKEDQGG